MRIYPRQKRLVVPMTGMFIAGVVTILQVPNTQSLTGIIGAGFAVLLFSSLILMYDRVEA